MKLTEITQNIEPRKYITDPEEVRNWLSKAMGNRGSYAHGSLISVRNDGVVSFMTRSFAVELTFTDPYLPIKFSYTSSIIVKNKFLESLEGFPATVEGDFICAYTKIKTLEGGPKTVRGNFNITENRQLKSLKGGPDYVGGEYLCQMCDLRSLEGSPTNALPLFNCSINKNLKSLEHAPKTLEFYATECDLHSLKGAPEHVTSFSAMLNPNLNSLEGCPSSIDNHMYLDECGIFSLVGIEKHIKDATSLSFGRVSEGGIGALYIEGLNSISFTTPNGSSAPSDIIQEFTERPEDFFECQAELLDNGYEDYAKL